MSALAGTRVLVTRAAEDQAPLAGLLRARGAEPVALPCIELQPPADQAPLQALLDRLAAGPPPDLVVVASPHAARRFAEQLVRRGLSLAGTRWAAVGEATAKTLRELPGIGEVLAPASGAGADALLAHLGDGARGLRVVLPRAEEANPELPAGLRQRGALVDEVVLYQTATAKGPDPGAMWLLRARLVHGITFASGSAARGFAELLGPDAAGLAGGCAVACMGARCAEVARAAGLRVDAVGEGGLPELVDAVERAVAQR